MGNRQSVNIVFNHNEIVHIIKIIKCVRTLPGKEKKPTIWL